MFWDFLRNITKIFENHSENFQKKFRNISKIITENLKKYLFHKIF